MLNVEKASNSKHIAICNFPLNLSTDCPFLKRPNNLWCDQCDKSLVPRWHLLSDKERGHGVVWYGFVRCVAYCAKLALPTAQLSNCPNFLTWTVCPLHYHILKKRFLGTLKLQKWHCKKDHSWTLTADHPRFVQTLSCLIFTLQVTSLTCFCRCSAYIRCVFNQKDELSEFPREESLFIFPQEYVRNHHYSLQVHDYTFCKSSLLLKLFLLTVVSTLQSCISESRVALVKWDRTLLLSWINLWHY